MSVDGIRRPYSKEQVRKLQGSVRLLENEYARLMSEKLRRLLQERKYIHTLGSITGGQAVQMAKAGLEAIYCSGWMVAAEQNLAQETYPDQGIYPSNSVPYFVNRMVKALRRADEIDYSEDLNKTDYFLPIVADAEHGFGGPLNTFELVKQMIVAGAAGVHLEDQAQNRRCGHAGGKTLVPTSEFIRKLVAARLAADVLDVPTVIIARTDAKSATYITSDIDKEDWKFLKERTGMDYSEYIRTPEGFYEITGGVDMAIARGLAYAPYADMLWMEDSTPSLENAKKFADAIHAEYPGKMLAFNCSPSFRWTKFLNAEEIKNFQEELGKLGYRYQFITLAGFHSNNNAMFELARDYKENNMTAYVNLQEREIQNEKYGFTAVKHQRESAMSYYDLVSETVGSSDVALRGSTEDEQFSDAKKSI